MPETITLLGGLLCAAVGLTVMVAWFARVTVILRFGSQNPMAANTALAFVVTGIALVALTRGWPRAVLVAGLFDAILGAAILTEIALGRSLGIDQLIVEAYISGPHDVPGRVAINTAACLTLAGVALLVWGPWRHRRRPAALAAGASVIAAIAVGATFGYATGNPKAYGWAHLTVMAFLTAFTMLVLAISLLSAAWQDSSARRAGLPRWLPMPAGALALGLGVWLAQQAEGRRRMALAAVARRADAERVAREGESRLFQFLDVMPVGVFIAAPGGHPYYASDEGVRLLGNGVAPDVGSDELAETYNTFQVGTDRPYPTESLPIVRALLGHPSHVDDVEIRKPDGSETPLEVWGCPVYGADGEIDYAIAAFADMSDRNAREKIITGQAALLELAYDAIFVRDLDGRITYWNAGAEHAYGFTRVQAVGQVSQDLLSTQFPEPRASIEAITSQRGRWDGELVQRRADGQIITVESRWAAQRGLGGSLLGFMEINRDITARKGAEREALRRVEDIQALNATLEERVQQRTEHLERANKNLAAFTCTAANDLRSPLRALSGYAEVLVEEYGDRLEETGRRLHRTHPGSQPADGNCAR